MYLKHFGLTHDPLAKLKNNYIDNEQYTLLEKRCQWLLDTRGVGLITGDAGTGKTAAVRQWVAQLSPHQYQIYYQADNHFRPFDIYSQLAEHLGLDIHHRYSQLWRNIKRQLAFLYHEKRITVVWLLDEAQNLPFEFFQHLPSFLNTEQDTQTLSIILLVGNPKLHHMLKRASLAPLTSRLQFHFQWTPLKSLTDFAELIQTAFKQAGRQDTLISDTGFQIIHLAAKGRLRTAHQIITRTMQLASEKKLNHLPDEVIESAIEELRSMMA